MEARATAHPRSMPAGEAPEGVRTAGHEYGSRPGLLSRPATAVFACLLLVLAVCEILLALTPPFARDALIHHLAVPRLWLRHGGFFAMPWADFSYYPMNVDLLYLLALLSGSDIVPNFIHLGFAAGTALLVYRYLLPLHGRGWGLFGALAFGSTPIVARLAAVAYVDLGLTFFTTGSLLALLHWRAGGCRERKWIVLSALAMGLALGCKYNALIAWLFLNFMAVWFAVREGRRPAAAFKDGALYFVVAMLVVSPWYVKNALLTGNPLYPFFDAWVQQLLPFTISGGAPAGATPGGGAQGIFAARHLLYGEDLWDVLLIPVRIFFQGRDGSDRYFDGVLSPLLLVLPPLAFLSRETRRDAWPMAAFSVFYVVVALFSEVVRVRYLLPVVPCLAILGAAGLSSLTARLLSVHGAVKAAGLGAVGLVLLVCLTANGIHVQRYFQEVAPLPYILQKESRDDFLASRVGSYPAMRYANANLPGEATLYLVFLGRRGYYLDRDYRYDGMNSTALIDGLAKPAGDEGSFLARLHATGCSHVLLRTDLFLRYVEDNFDPPTRRLLLARMSAHMPLLYQAGGYAILGMPVARGHGHRRAGT